MKTFMNLLVLTLTFAVISCGDIVDSDSNIKKFEITYGNPLSNQETNVILPLKVGNLWYYEVKKLNENKQIVSTTYDSIKVLNIIKNSENNEIWYEVYFPFINKPEPSQSKNVLMINTDKGLLINCEDCLTKKFLWAKYPQVSDLYLSYQDYLTVRDANNHIITQDVITIGKQSQGKQILYNNDKGNLETYFYKSYIMNGMTYNKEFDYMDEYYFLDFGLIKLNQRDRIYNYTYEYNYIKNLGNECANDTTVNSGLLNDIGRQVVKIKLTNNFANSISVNSSDIKIEDNEKVEIEIIPLSFPITINPGQSVDLELSIIRKISGSFNSEIYVNSNLGCWYRINLLAYFN